MEFIENNYVWIIVVGVIVLMTIIGYFADKAETKEKKPKKKKKNQVINSVPEVEETTETEELPPEWDENNKPVDEEQEIMNIEGSANTDDWNVLPEDNFASDEIKLDETENKEELENEIEWNTLEITPDMKRKYEENLGNSEVELENTNEEISELENNIEETNELENDVENTEIEQENSTENEEDYNLLENDVPINEEENQNEEESIPEETNELNNLEITLPNIETLNEEIKEDDDDDVWKF